MPKLRFLPSKTQYYLSLLCSISTRLLLSKSVRIFCLAYSSGNGNFSKAFCTNKQGLMLLERISMPFTKIARPCAISLWHRRCFAVGHGNCSMREHSSENCGFSPSQRVSMSRSWIVFKLSIWIINSKNVLVM